MNILRFFFLKIASLQSLSFMKKFKFVQKLSQNNLSSPLMNRHFGEIYKNKKEWWRLTVELSYQMSLTLNLIGKPNFLVTEGDENWKEKFVRSFVLNIKTLKNIKTFMTENE
jgi:hypothetical protein